MKAGFIGAGSWGTALANLIAGSGVNAALWDLDSALIDDIAKTRENKKYLPGLFLRDSVIAARAREDCLRNVDFVVFAVPAQHFRSALISALPEIPAAAPIVNVAKGIELGTLLTISAVAKEVAPEREFAILSGPSHAEEVAQGMPTTVTVASKRIETAEAVQDLFMSERFRVYTQSDVIGVELGGALKNVIALGAGISDGMGYGDNTKAALMTRGITEMARLGQKLGAKRETFFGLSGIGDLIVTCTSMHSRNRRCGIMIGEGVDPEEALTRVGMVVEGIPTAEAAYALARRENVEMPIAEAIYRVTRGELPPSEALSALMTRERKHEYEDLRL